MTQTPRKDKARMRPPARHTSFASSSTYHLHNARSPHQAQPSDSPRNPSLRYSTIDLHPPRLWKTGSHPFSITPFHEDAASSALQSRVGPDFATTPCSSATSASPGQGRHELNLKTIPGSSANSSHGMPSDHFPSPFWSTNDIDDKSIYLPAIRVASILEPRSSPADSFTTYIEAYIDHEIGSSSWLDGIWQAEPRPDTTRPINMKSGDK